jgi:hypothetical protein
VNVDEIAAGLFHGYAQWHMPGLAVGSGSHDRMKNAVCALAAEPNGLLDVHRAGASLEGRDILSVSFGTGAHTVLLWSQMHGDEPTATLALCDVFRYLALVPPTPPWVTFMLQHVRVVALPMLNPDGAERWQRQTAARIDMNRDARVLATPEARLLKATYERLHPEYAFNLHDQSPRTNGSQLAALALLAPSGDVQGSVTSTRRRAMHLGAFIVNTLRPFAGERITTYDDTYEPRAFGDAMQAWGTSTLLIESGHWPGDPAKEMIRKLNFVSLLCAFVAIAHEEVEAADVAAYVTLPPNKRTAFEVIFRGVLLKHAAGWSQTVDMGFQREPSPGGKLMLKEVGDLAGFAGVVEEDARGVTIDAEKVPLNEFVEPAELLLRMQKQG